MNKKKGEIHVLKPMHIQKPDEVVMPQFYGKLDENKNVVPASINDCGASLEERHVARDDGYYWCDVSTVFLGINHSHVVGEYLWFETMVFGGKLDGEQMRYETWKQAEAGHKKMKRRVKWAWWREYLKFAALVGAAWWGLGRIINLLVELWRFYV